MNQIDRHLIQKGVKWTFNPSAGAHHGGIWERIIRMVKKFLSSITHTRKTQMVLHQAKFLCERHRCGG